MKKVVMLVTLLTLALPMMAQQDAAQKREQEREQKREALRKPIAPPQVRPLNRDVSEAAAKRFAEEMKAEIDKYYKDQATADPQLVGPFAGAISEEPTSDQHTPVIRRYATPTAKQAPTPAQEVNYLIQSKQIDDPTSLKGFEKVVPYVFDAREDDALLNELLEVVNVIQWPDAPAAALYPFVKDNIMDANVRESMQAKYNLCNNKLVDDQTLDDYNKYVAKAQKVSRDKALERMGRAKQDNQ